MPRPLKSGVDYFPLDVDFFTDIKVRRVKKDCGPASVSVLICLLCNIYRDGGYYIRWNEDMAFVIAEITGVAEGAVLEIVSKAIQVNFFNKRLFEREKILTSAGIQKRYTSIIRASKLKRDEIKTEHNLIESSEEIAESSEETGKSSEETANSSEESTQRKEKKSKVKNTLLSQLADGESDERKRASREVKFTPDSNPYKAAEYMAKCILGHSPTHPQLREDKYQATLQRWASDIDKLLRIDKVPFDEFKAVLRFSQNDTFWQQNILSGKKLREQYGTLLVRMNTGGNGDD